MTGTKDSRSSVEERGMGSSATRVLRMKAYAEARTRLGITDSQRRAQLEKEAGENLERRLTEEGLC